MNTKLMEQFDGALSHVKRDGMEEFLQWLKTETDYFTAPASTSFHNNHEGGLLEHSLNVLRFALHNFNLIVKYNPELEYLKESIIISALFHDLCKVNFYKKEEKWTKDANNKWKSYLGWGVDNKFPLGHGEKSLYLLAKFIDLTDGEALAIRWHMGYSEMSVNVYGTAQKFAFDQAIEHPLVRIIHTADLLAISLEKHTNYKTL